jgi:hypothetical protein
VTQVKRRIYGELPSGALSAIGPTGGSPISAISHQAPHANDDTFLRLRAQFTMSVIVGSPTADVPPESWWSQTYITLVAWWSPTGSTALGNITGSSEHYLGSQLLVPIFQPGASDPQEYVVTWKQDQDLITETARRDPAATARPRINIGFTVYDTTPALDGSYTAIQIAYDTRLFTLWGSAT